MACGCHCENVRLQLGDYHLKSYMFFMDIDGCDIVLGAKWLCTLSPVAMDFKELYLSFTQKSHTHMLKGLLIGSLEIISSHMMKKLLNKGHIGVVIQLIQCHTSSLGINIRNTSWLANNFGQAPISLWDIKGFTSYKRRTWSWYSLNFRYSTTKCMPLLISIFTKKWNWKDNSRAPRGRCYSSKH